MIGYAVILGSVIQACKPSNWAVSTAEPRPHNSEPKFSLKPTRAGLAVYEENSGHAFILPTPQKGHPVSFLAELHDLILPNWAREFYLSRLKSDNS